MTRRLLNVLTALSLLLCLAVAALWGRSYWRLDQLIMRVLGEELAFTSLHGQLGVSWSEPSGTPEVGWIWFKTRPRNASVSTLWQVGLVRNLAEPMASRVVWLSVWFPHWSVCALAVAAPVYRLLSARRVRSWRQQGLCPR